MPDALFHYALLAHMRSSCIRRRLKKSIFPTLPSSFIMKRYLIVKSSLLIMSPF